MWEQFALQFAGGAGKGLTSGGPVSSGINARDQSWSMGGGDWVVNMPTAVGPGATASGTPTGSNTMLMIAAGLAALWILKGR